MSQALEDPLAQLDQTIEKGRGAGGAPAGCDNAANAPAAKQRESHSDRGPKPPEPSDEKQGKQQSSLLGSIRHHPFVVMLIAAVVLMGAAAALFWWLDARHDAFIDARTVSISSQINGAIIEVPVDDNQAVDANAALARIDDLDFRAALDQAKAQIDQAVAGIANLDAQVEAQTARIAEKQVSGAQAALTFSQEENRRAQDLLKRGAGTQQQAQQNASDLFGS